MEYSILITYVQYGHLDAPCKKEEVRKKCEELRHTYEKLSTGNVIIEVMNNITGEIRKYWDNYNNKIGF